MPTNRITLELRNPKSSELGPQAAEQLFAALPETTSGIFPWSSPEAIAFEILSINQTSYFQLNFPEPLDQYFRSQLHAAYPEVLISPATPETANFPAFFQGSVTATTLRLAHGSIYPLRTHKDFPETDPLSASLGILAKLPPNQAALIQILVRPESDSWKNHGYKVAAGSTDSEGHTTPNPFKTQIETKLALICHRAAIKIAVSTPNSTASNHLLTSFTKSFAAIASAEGNQLKPHTPLFSKNSLKNSLQYRDFSHTTKQYLSVEELATLYHLPSESLKNIKNIAWGKNLLGEPPEDLPTLDSIPEAERTGVNIFAQAEHKNETKVFGIKDGDRRRHIYVMGKTGTGKSTLLANMAINDLKQDKGLAVIDPHGDLVETLLDYIPSSRINDVVYLNPADPEYTVKLNLLEATEAEHKELVSSGIIAIFKKLYGYSWGPRLEYILRNTLLTLLTRDQSTLEDVIKLLTNNNFRKRVIEKLEDPVLLNFWTKEFASWNDRLQAEAVSPILNKVGQFVSSPLIRNVINSTTNSFSIKEVMDEGKILLCNLSQGKLGEDNSALLGAMIITKIQLTSMSRVYIPEAERRDFYLYVDEFQNFATQSFIKILSEARKYRLNLTLANQYIDQIDEDVRKAIFGNCATMINFIVGAQDADHLSKEFGSLYGPDDLVALERYQVVTRLSIDNMTSPPFPAITLPIAESTNQHRDKVIAVSRERYSRKRTFIIGLSNHMAEGQTPKTKPEFSSDSKPESRPEPQRSNQSHQSPPHPDRPSQSSLDRTSHAHQKNFPPQHSQTQPNPHPSREQQHSHSNQNPQSRPPRPPTDRPRHQHDVTRNIPKNSHLNLPQFQSSESLPPPDEKQLPPPHQPSLDQPKPTLRLEAPQLPPLPRPPQS